MQETLRFSGKNDLFIHFRFVFLQKHSATDAQIDLTEENRNALDIVKAGCRIFIDVKKLLAQCSIKCY